uniref:Cytochrome P450 n=1 Tax=Leersia perrieri TaxID=77586 RepID=A0A0D9XAI8_9ORYZ
MLLLYAALFSAVALYLAAAVAFRRRGNAGLPPGPTGLPLVGSLLSLDPELHTYFAGLAARYGPIFSIRLGSKLGVVVSSPALAREMLRGHNDLVFSSRDIPDAARAITYGGKQDILGVVVSSPALAREMLRGHNDLVFSSRDIPDAARAITYGGKQDIVWSPVGPTWRLLRRICVREMLSPAGLDNVAALRRREFMATMRHLHAVSASGGGEAPVDVGAQMFLTTMNVVAGTLWGGNIAGGGGEGEREAVGKEFRDLVADMTEMLGAPNVSDFFPALAPFDLQGIRKKSDMLKHRFDEIFARIIQQRTTKGGGGDETAADFLEYMLKLEKEGGDGKAAFTMTNDLVVGGTETTSNTVEWAMAELLKDRRALRKVKEELDAVVGRDAVVEEHHLPRLHYLQLVLKETLRLHPALPLMVPHCPTEDAIVAGHRVPAGSRVFVNVWAIQRDPAVWENPGEFIPERFENAGSGDGGGRRLDFTGSEHDYMPFGSGRRICAGIAMAERMAGYSLALLMQAFDWDLPAGERLDMEERFAIVMKKARPLVAVPTPRLSKPDLYYSS